jgi:hypothetical protein
MNTRLVTIIIIIFSFSTGLYTGILFGRQYEKREQQQKNFFLQQEISRIG